MVSKRLVAGGAAIAVTAAVGVWGLLEVTDDPDRDVATIDLGSVQTSSGSETGGDSAATVPVGTEALVGTVERIGDDVDDLAVNGVELDFGPDEWVRSAGPIEDYDGDGDLEALRVELDGLVGREVDLEVTYDDDGERDDADVMAIDGLAIGVPTGGGAEASQDEVGRAAEAAIGNGARAVEVDRDDEDGTFLWEVEVLDADGREHTVVLNAAGEVLGTEADD